MCSAGGQGGAAVDDGQMEPLRMPGVMSSAGKELAELLTEMTVSRFSWVFFFSSPPCSGYSVDLGVKLCVSTVASQCWEPVLPGPV